MKWGSVWHHFVVGSLPPPRWNSEVSFLLSKLYLLPRVLIYNLSVYLSIFLFHWTILKIYLLAVFFFFHVLLRCDFRLIWHLSASLRFSISALLLNHLLVSTTGCMLFVLHSSARRLPILLNPLFRWLKKMKLFLCDFLLIIFSLAYQRFTSSFYYIARNYRERFYSFYSFGILWASQLVYCTPQLFCPCSTNLPFTIVMLPSITLLLRLDHRHCCLLLISLWWLLIYIFSDCFLFVLCIEKYTFETPFLIRDSSLFGFIVRLSSLTHYSQIIL